MASQETPLWLAHVAIQSVRRSLLWEEKARRLQIESAKKLNSWRLPKGKIELSPLPENKL